MPRLTLDPLTADAFAPFGDVIECPAEPGRDYFSDALATSRAHAAPSLSVTLRAPSTLPLRLEMMERHEHSSQTFLPLDVSRYIVVVAPKDDQGGPDMSQARGFVAGGNQGVTFAADTWHAPNAVLDRPGRMAVFMWLADDGQDEEFRTLDTAIDLHLGTE